MTKTLDVLSSSIPQLYYDADSNLITILEQYYKWLDSEFIDVSAIRSAEAEQVFVDRMLEEYAPGIEKTESTNQQLLAKYATELFRAKGTPRAIDLFFRLVFHVNASVSFPRESLFKPSSGEYSTPQFVEITNSRHVDQFNNTYVLTSSGGTMFVESIQRTQSRVLLIVSDVSGTVGVGDTIYTTNDTRKNPSTIVGSLNDVRVDSSFDGFEPGRQITLKSASGKQAHGYVSQTNTLGTKATFDLISKGVGFTPHPEITVSEQTIKVSQVQAGNTVFQDGDTVSQQLYAGAYTEGEGEFEAGEQVTFEKYESNTLVSSVTATIVATEQTVDAGGRLIIQSSAPQANITGANYVASATSSGNNMVVTSINATAEVVSPDTSTTVFYSSNQVPFKIGDSVSQGASKGVITRTPTANTVVIDVESGQFVPGVAINNQQGAAIFTPTDISQFIGIRAITNKFYPNGSVTIGDSVGKIDVVSSGSKANFVVSSLAGSRTSLIAADQLDPNAQQYFASTGVVFDGQQYFAVPTGAIDQIQVTSSGETYDYPPIATIKQPMTDVSVYSLDVGSSEGLLNGEFVQQTGVSAGSFYLTVSNISPFTKGMVVTQGSGPATAVGIVESVNSATSVIGVVQSKGAWSTGIVARTADGSSTGATVTSVAATDALVSAAGQIIDKTADTITVAGINPFVVGGTIQGRSSGAKRAINAVTNVTSSYPQADKTVVRGRLVRVGGKISKVEVQYCEPGFKDSEYVEIYVGDSLIGNGTAVTGPFGTFKPVFGKQGSAPSGLSRVYDSDFYQHLSYEIKTSVNIDKYPNNKEFLQLAGMKMFIHNEIDTYTSVSTPVVEAETEVVDV